MTAAITKEVAPLAGRIRPQLLGLNDDAASGWVDVSQCDALRFLAQAGALDSGAVAVTIEQAAPDASGAPDAGTVKAVGTYGGALSVNASVLEGEVPISALDINGGFKFARLKFLSDGNSGPTVTGPAVSGALFAHGLRSSDTFTATASGDETVGAGPAGA